MKKESVRTLCYITKRDCGYEYNILGPTDMDTVIGANITYTDENTNIPIVLLDTVIESIETDNRHHDNTIIINGRYLIKSLPKSDD